MSAKPHFITKDTIYVDNYIHPLRTVRHTLGTYLVDLSISKIEWSQNPILSGLYLWSVLLHRHQSNTHDWQLHPLQLPPMHPWFLFRSTRDLLLSSAPPRSRGSDKSGSNRFSVYYFHSVITPLRFDFENWHVLKWLFYNFIYSVFPPILNLMLTSISSASQQYCITNHQLHTFNFAVIMLFILFLLLLNNVISNCICPGHSFLKILNIGNMITI